MRLGHSAGPGKWAQLAGPGEEQAHWRGADPAHWRPGAGDFSGVPLAYLAEFSSNLQLTVGVLGGQQPCHRQVMAHSERSGKESRRALSVPWEH